MGSLRYAYPLVPSRQNINHKTSTLDGVLSNPQILGVPLLLLANKQDSPQSLSVDEIRHDYEDWYQRKLESARRTRYGEDSNAEVATRRERIASLDVMGVSALEG
jgi:ADP-ribosylation factor related protein 1